MEIGLIVYPSEKIISLDEIEKFFKSCSELLHSGLLLNITEPMAEAHNVKTAGQARILHILVPSAGDVIYHFLENLFHFLKSKDKDFFIKLIKKDRETIVIPWDIPRDKLDLLLKTVGKEKISIQNIVIEFKNCK